MKFKQFSAYLIRLDSTTKRLEITSILKEMLKELDEAEIRCGVYLALGYLRAPYEDKKFNIADKMIFRILEQAYSTVTKAISTEEITQMYKKSGDLGNVTYSLAPESEANNLTVMQVHQRLEAVANLQGTGSQEQKTKQTAAFLKELDKESAKYVVRIILGTTRLGFTELTVINALALFLGDKTLADQIEATYSTHPDIGLVAEKIKTKGINGLNDVTIESGVPVLSQRAQRLGSPEEIIEKMGRVWAEYKFDGTRVQLHLDRAKPARITNFEQNTLFGQANVKHLTATYTRNLEETTHQYPDILAAAERQITATSAILDGEAIGYNKKTGAFLPFQETMQRKRKHNIADTAQNIPLKYFVFDILYLNGDSLVDLPLSQRRSKLAKIIEPGEVIQLTETLETSDVLELTKYFDSAKEKGLEGIVVKKPEDKYQAGARSFSWVKFKRADEKLLDDSIDCVVLGYYAGKGVRSKFGIGGFLVGIYDKGKDSFVTISKIGTGLADEDFLKLKKLCDKVKTDKIPGNVIMDKAFKPDVITNPKIVVEIGADEISVSPSHSAGYALRFPRLLKFREDKNPSEISTLKEIVQMYKHQEVARSTVV